MTTLERLLVNLDEVELADNEKDRTAAKAALREAVAATRKPLKCSSEKSWLSWAHRNRLSDILIP